MSAPQDDVSTELSASQPVQRPTGLKRLLSKAKTVITRHGSSLRGVASRSQSFSGPATLAALTEQQHTPFMPVSAGSRYDVPFDLLVPDDEEDQAQESAFPAVPLSTLERAAVGMHEAKARQLFARHNLTYHTRAGAHEEPARKMRRVERDIRMRVRWTCHACRTVFGQDKYCPNCGHRRCFDCERDPKRKTKLPAPEVLPLEAGDSSGIEQPKPREGEAITSEQSKPWSCTIQIGRPRAVLPKFSSASRQCHQCAASSTDLDELACATCGHDLCDLCPTGASSQQVAVPLVERVYRKPRLRVRFHCELCNTQYTDRSHCVSCGHERCESCPRFPPRKRKHSPEPAGWQALLEAKYSASDQAERPVSAGASARQIEPHARL